MNNSVKTNTTMSIRILHFDTSLLDAQVAWLTLKSDELQPDIEHVESFEEFEEALEEQPFDLVLCEYALQKRKTANDVIAYLKSKSLALPVIVLSKITDEAVVAEVLKNGASDYVFKSHLKFLPASIKEVLSRKPVSKPQTQAPPPSEEFLKNLEALRAQLARLQSPFVEDEPRPASTTEKEPAKPLPDAPSHAATSVVIEEMQKKIDELNETIATLNANNFELQNALEQSRAQIESLKGNATADSHLESQLEEARHALNELAEALKTAQEQARLSATAYEEERQSNARLKAELIEKSEREKELMNEVDKAQEAEMQLRIELQEAVITGNQLREAIANATEQLSRFEAMFKQYESALNQQMSNAESLSEQMQTAKAELANAKEEKQSLESKLTAAQEAAQSLAQRFAKELGELRAKLDEETNKRQTLEQALAQANQTIQTLSNQPKGDPEKEARLAAELAEAQSAISQLRADWEQADREVERLENDVKILESSVQEKNFKLHDAQKELKAKERALAEKSAILDALNVAVIVVSASGEIRYWNESAAVFHGVPAGEALGKKSDEVMKYKYASSKERKAAMESLQSVGRWDGKVKYLTPDGEQKTAEMFISRLDDEVGNPLGALTLLTDATKRSAMESEYHDFKQRIEPMLNALPVSIFAFDDAGIITGVFGKPSDQYHLSDAKGKSIYELYAKSPQLLDAFRRVLSGESVTASLARSESQVEFHFSPILSSGQIKGAVGALVETKSPVEQA